MNRFQIWQLLVRVLFEDQHPKINDDLRRRLLPYPQIWREMISMANANYVTHALWEAICHRGLQARVAPDALDYLESFAALMAHRISQVRDQTAESLSALTDAGTQAMLLKGAAYMFGDLQGYARSRIMSDIDILVAPDALDAARNALLRLDYRPVPSPTVDYSIHHHIEPMHHPKRPLCVELHRAPVPAKLEAALPSSEIWRNSRITAIHGMDVFLPSPTDAASIIFLHNVLVDRCTAYFLLPLRSFLDLHALQANSAADIDWHQVASRANEVCAGRELRRLAYIQYRLSSQRIMEDLSFRVSDAVHFGICQAVAAKPYLIEVMLRIDRLSNRRIRKLLQSA